MNPSLRTPRRRVPTPALVCRVLLAAVAAAGVAAALPARAEEAPTVLITGANRGIGLELARQYAERGWHVIATCRTPAEAQELRAIAGEHRNVAVEPMDVTNFACVDALAAKYRGKPIDVLVHTK